MAIGIGLLVVLAIVTLTNTFKPTTSTPVDSSLSRQHDNSKSLSASVNSSGGNMAYPNSNIVYGTAWKKDETARLVDEAVRAGFRSIDTACQPKHYNEAGVGEGWVKAAMRLNLKREDLYLQTKFTSLNGQDKKNVPYDAKASLEDQVRQSVAKSLENLQTDYLDALVLHSPMDDFEDTLTVWRTMETFVGEDKHVRRLGISNCYDMDTFHRLYIAATIKPTVLQNRFYAESHFDPELRAFCKDHGITYQTFWTLSANRSALHHPMLQQMARTKGLTPQTLMYAFVMTLGHTPLSGTTDQEHMAEDVTVMNRMKSDEEEILNRVEMVRMSKFLGMSSEV